MSKLLNTYLNLKKQNPKTIYLFKSGLFYIALEDDAKLLSNQLNLKITNLNDEAVKCGFPVSSFDKYFPRIKEINEQVKILDKDTISEAANYVDNKNIQELITEIKNVDINNLSVSQAFAFIEKIKANVSSIK